MKRVAIFEDNVPVREILESVVLEAGHEVVHAGSGHGALDHVAEDRPDLIFLDLHLEGVRGDDIYTCLRSDPRTKALPIVICTVHHERSRKLASAERSWDPNLYMLFKPFPMANAILLIQALLAR